MTILARVGAVLSRLHYLAARLRLPASVLTRLHSQYGYAADAPA